LFNYPRLLVDVQRTRCDPLQRRTNMADALDAQPRLGTFRIAMHDSPAETGHASTSPADTQPPRRPSLLALFLLFSELGLSSFGGGVSAWIHRACVERRGWLTESEFAAALALARIMPGANVINLAIIVAQRQRGVAGAVAAALGLLVGPGLVVIGLAAVYQRFAEADVLASMLEGTAAAAVGLILAMGLTSGMSIVRAAFKSGGPTRHGIVAVAMIGATFVLVGVLRWPTVATVLCLAPLSIASAWFAAAPRPERKP
jgi:chromate transporter